MADSSMGLHEDRGDLSPGTLDRHRGIVSLMEELEAIDWYQQRADATKDGALKAVMLHNRNEEVEHAMMTLEWIRRRDAKFDETARTYLFTELPITEVEEAKKAMNAAGADSSAKTSASSAAHPASLGIGSLRSGLLAWIF